jgi:hypothetical protein
VIEAIARLHLAGSGGESGAGVKRAKAVVERAAGKERRELITQLVSDVGVMWSETERSAVGKWKGRQW